MLVDTGVLIGVGTDTPYLYNWSGESLHRELELWVEGRAFLRSVPFRRSPADNARS